MIDPGSPASGRTGSATPPADVCSPPSPHHVEHREDQHLQEIDRVPIGLRARRSTVERRRGPRIWIGPATPSTTNPNPIRDVQQVDTGQEEVVGEEAAGDRVTQPDLMRPLKTSSTPRKPRRRRAVSAASRRRERSLRRGRPRRKVGHPDHVKLDSSTMVLERFRRRGSVAVGQPGTAVDPLP